MSQAAETSADLTAPPHPAAYRRRTRLRAWGLAGFGLLCMAGGAMLAVLGVRMIEARPALRLPAETPAAMVAPAATQPAASPLIVAPTYATPSAPSAEVSRLSERVAALESHEARTLRGAVSALAAAAVVEASQSSRPFREEVAAMRNLSPQAPELVQLSRLAETGAPSRAALAASFADYAARAAAAARRPGEGARLGARIAYALSHVISLRRVGEVEGSGPDARLATAERLVEDGDIDEALRMIETLPQAAREAMSPWRARAERRAEIDRLAAALRARALRDLSEPAA